MVLIKADIYKHDLQGQVHECWYTMFMKILYHPQIIFYIKAINSLMNNVKIINYMITNRMYSVIAGRPVSLAAALCR